jgi:hypothetical protein
MPWMGVRDTSLWTPSHPCTARSHVASQDIHGSTHLPGLWLDLQSSSVGPCCGARWPCCVRLCEASTAASAASAAPSAHWSKPSGGSHMNVCIRPLPFTCAHACMFGWAQLLKHKQLKHEHETATMSVPWRRIGIYAPHPTCGCLSAFTRKGQQVAAILRHMCRSSSDAHLHAPRWCEAAWQLPPMAATSLVE